MNNSVHHKQIQKILVLGGGSAGFLAALSLKTKHPQLEVTVVRSKEIGTIMVGEGTTDSVPVYLHGYLGIDPGEFHEKAQPTWKMGIRFVWGKRPHFNFTFSQQLVSQYDMLPRPNGFYCQDIFEYTDISGALMQHDRIFERGPDNLPMITKNVAYHLENSKLVDFLEMYAERVGVVIRDDTVREVEQDESGVTALQLASGDVETADLYVDCSGFRSVLLGGALRERYISYDSSLFCDRAITGGWERGEEPIKPYTTSETMDSGWAWKIEHENRLNRGYVYSSAFASDEEVEKEFRTKNPLVDETRQVKFRTGRYENQWVKNVVAIGNSSGFVEPLQSSSLAVICELCANVVRTLTEGNMIVKPSQVEYYNRTAVFLWDSVRDFLAVNYKFNNRLETPFWKACQADVDLAGAAEIVHNYRENGPSTAWAPLLISPIDPFGLEGYLTMIVGQKVPHQNSYQPGQSEWQFWNSARAHLFGRAQNGFTVGECLAMMRQPEWEWNSDFYRSASHW